MRHAPPPDDRTTTADCLEALPALSLSVAKGKKGLQVPHAETETRTDVLKQAEAKLIEALAHLDTLSPPHGAFEEQARLKIVSGIDALRAAIQQ